MRTSFLLLTSLLAGLQAENSRLNPRPRQVSIDVSTGRRFRGGAAKSEDPNASDHFKLLEADGDSLLVGARDAVYNLSLSTLDVLHTIEWAPPATLVETCMMKGKSKNDCYNYIRVMIRQSAGRALICGTYAFSPKCREYVYSPQEDKPVNHKQFDGAGISPYDPKHNSTAVYLPETDEIFTGTVTDFAGNDPLIYRRRLSGADDVGLRTVRDDVRVLDTPNFVSSFSYGEHVYFWYRERAAEALDNNEERQVYARVARVCKGDRGGPTGNSRDRWTSFAKARLNCSLADPTPFYFNELKAVSDPVEVKGGAHVVYAVFSTPKSELGMSAVCAFSMEEIRHLFDHGTFKHQKSVDYAWAPFMKRDLPRPRPTACAADSQKLPEATVNFATRYPLLYEAVPALPNSPLVIQGSDKPELTQIAALSQVKDVTGVAYDVVFVGTSDGQVQKFVVENGGPAIPVQRVTVFASAASVVNLMVTPTQLIVVSADEIAALTPHRCGLQTSCAGCVRLQDPHCAWNTDSKRCESSNGKSWRGENWVQNVREGQSEQCPEMIGDANSYAINDASSERPYEASIAPSAGFSVPLLLLLLFVAVVASTMLGLLVGYRLARWRLLTEGQHHSSSSSSGSDYDSYGRQRLTRHDSLTASAKMDHVYGTAPKNGVDTVSLVLTMPAVGAPGTGPPLSGAASGMTTPRHDRNAVLTSLNNSTLPRDYRVKKVYL